MTLFGFEVVFSATVLGLINGMVYGILAVGLVLVYRSSRVINFAHGQVGALGAAVMAILVTQWHVSYYLAFVVAVAVAAAVSALTEAVVVRKLRNAPLVMTIVATVGVGEVLTGLSLSLNPKRGGKFPTPPGFPTFQVGALRVDPAASALLLVCPLLVLGLVLFFKRSPFGLAMRGSAVNPGSAVLSGISPNVMAGLAWGLAGGVSALTAILVVPSRGITDAASFGPSLLLLALVGAVIGKMQSLPRALMGGLAVGVIESWVNWNYPTSGATDLVLFVVLLGVLMLQQPEGGRVRDKGSHATLAPWRSLPAEVAALPAIRLLRPLGLVVAVAAAVGITPFVTNRAASVLIGLVCFSLMGLGIVLLTGLGGQVSLGQFGIAAVAAVVAYHLAESTLNFGVAFVGAGLVAAAVSVVVGLPALRVKGLMLAVTSLAFARVAISWLLPQSWALGDGVRHGPAGFGTVLFDSTKSYYLFSLGVFAVGGLLAWNYRRSGLGLRLAALRDNEDAARSFSIPATRDKLLAFAVAGFLTGLGGALYAYSITFVSADSFPLKASISVVALSALGGIGVLGGPVLGALYIIALPAFVHLDAAVLAVSSLGWLVLVLLYPGGLAQLVAPLRERLVTAIAARSGLDYQALSQARAAGGDGSVAHTELVDSEVQAPSSSPGEVLLEVRQLSKSFGALRAVNDADLLVFDGEVLGLIGPNGAGKTTLFELIGGFTRADAGTVLFQSRDVTRTSIERRARTGLVRSFQDSSLFPTLTVLESLELAQERVSPTRVLPALAGGRRAKRARQDRARELAASMGLSSYADHLVAELSTGTRRIVELACLVSLKPRLLLLDEPSSGIAQSETDALAEVILAVKSRLQATIVVIEHDMGLIARISDRMIAMEAGVIIAEGRPDDVLTHPEVVRSYLGGELAPPESSTCTATNRTGGRCRKRGSEDGLCGTHRRMPQPHHVTTRQKDRA